jgi:hypothetical protein
VVEEIKAFISPDQLNPSVEAVRRDLSKIGSSGDQIDTLVYVVASQNVQLAHERAYTAIFGSQLQLLAQMNTDFGVPQSVARQIYETAKVAYPQVYPNYPFEDWIGFLLRGLITVAPNGNYVLTAYGRGLLRYIVDRHLSMNRQF